MRVPWQPGESLAGWVLSFGPDKKENTNDDIRIPEAAATGDKK